MEKKPRKQKRDSDFAVNAFRVVQESIGQTLETENANPYPRTLDLPPIAIPVVTSLL